MDVVGHTRRVNRVRMEASIAFWWVDSGIVMRGEGRTRDISEAGAFVLTSTFPPNGTNIGFKIFLPELAGSEHRARVEGDGQVLRVEQALERKGCGGFAILTQHMLLGVNTEIYERGESGDHKPQLSRTV